MQYNFWSLRCSWSIACRRCSNYIFILDLTCGFKGLAKDNCKTRRKTYKFGDFVRLTVFTTVMYLENASPVALIHMWYISIWIPSWKDTHAHHYIWILMLTVWTYWRLYKMGDLFTNDQNGFSCVYFVSNFIKACFPKVRVTIIQHWLKWKHGVEQARGSHLGLTNGDPIRSHM